MLYLNPRMTEMLRYIAARGDAGLTWEQMHSGQWSVHTAHALQRRGLVWRAHDRRLDDGRVVRCDHPEACPLPSEGGCRPYRGECADNFRFVLTDAGAAEWERLSRYFAGAPQ